MTYFNSWMQHSESPGAEISAARRALRTGERHVMDAAHDLESAKARGNAAEIAAAEVRLREMFEADVRRKGGRPEDFIPGYPDYIPVPVYNAFFGEWAHKGHVLWLAGAFALFLVFKSCWRK